MSAILEQQHQEQKIQVLDFKNKKLCEQLESQKQQISTLDKSVADYHLSKQQYNETLLCINRIWEQLQSNINLMCRSLSGVDSAQSEVSTSDADALDNIGDPFLKRLLCSDPSALKAVHDAQKEQIEDMSDIEKVLQQRAETTLSALSEVLQLIRERTAYNQQLLDRIAGADGHEALKEENARLRQESENFHKQLDGARAAQLSAQALLKQTDDRLFETQETIKQLKNELADKDYEMDILQRKLIRHAKGSGSGQGGSGAAEPHDPAAAHAPEASTSAAVPPDHEASEEMQAQLHELQQLLDKRTAELDKEKEHIIKLQR